MATCKTCELVNRRDAGEAPIWDSIHRTRYFDVAHAFNTSLPGWIVLVARRHVAAIDELTMKEAAELGLLIYAISKGLKAVVGCKKTYVMQFAEQEGHDHVHFHIVPRMVNLPDADKSVNILRHLGVGDRECISAAEMTDVAMALRRHLGGC